MILHASLDDEEPCKRRHGRPSKGLVQFNIKTRGDTKESFRRAYEAARKSRPSLTQGDYLSELLSRAVGNDEVAKIADAFRVTQEAVLDDAIHYVASYVDYSEAFGSEIPAFRWWPYESKAWISIEIDESHSIAFMCAHAEGSNIGWCGQARIYRLNRAIWYYLYDDQQKSRSRAAKKMPALETRCELTIILIRETKKELNRRGLTEEAA